MSFIGLINDFLSGLGREIELVNIKLIEFNEGFIREQESKKPFSVVRHKAQLVKGNAQIARVIIPAAYTNSREFISGIIDIADIIINFMNATIAHPEQRREVLKFLSAVSQQLETDNDWISFTSLDKVFYEHGLDSNASISDKIKLILKHEPKENEMEKVALELLPRMNEILKYTRSTLTNLQKKGIVTY